MMRCSCGGKLYAVWNGKVTEDGVIQRRRYECKACGATLSTSEVDVKEYRELKKKVLDLEIKLYTVRKVVTE